MYPKVGDLVIRYCHLNRGGWFKAIVVEDKGNAFHTIVLMDLKGDMKPGDSWILTKRNWELGYATPERWGTNKWKIESMEIKKGDLVITENGGNIRGIILKIMPSVYVDQTKAWVYCTHSQKDKSLNGKTFYYSLHKLRRIEYGT